MQVCVHMQVHLCVCFKGGELYTGRGETLFLPPSYFLQNSCVCQWGGGGHLKKGEGSEMIFSRYHTSFFSFPHTDVWILMGSHQVFSCGLPAWATGVKCLCQSRLFPRGSEWQQHPCSCQLARICTCGMMTELRIAKNALLDGLPRSPPHRPFLKRRCFSDVSIFHLLKIRDPLSYTTSIHRYCCAFVYFLFICYTAVGYVFFSTLALYSKTNIGKFSSSVISMTSIAMDRGQPRWNFSSGESVCFIYSLTSIKQCLLLFVLQ